MPANNVIDTLQVNINASSKSAKASIDELCASLEKLKASLDGIGNQKIKITTQAIEESGKKSEKAAGKLDKLALAAKKVLSVFGNASLKGLVLFTKGVTKLGKFLTKDLLKTLGIKNPFANFTKGGFSLLSMVGKLYAAFWLLRTAFGWVKDSVDFASSLVEVQNVVRNAFGPESEKMVNDFAGSVSMLNFGLSELTTKEIASKFQAMGVALGVTDRQVEATQKTISGLPESYDSVADSMADVSLNLTKLAADMGSFYNKNPDDVAKSLEAIFTGQTRPLRQYGLDLTQATLQEWALKHGIDADVASMTQAEKTMLRYQYVMNNARLSMGDFAKTADTWANVVKTLKQQFQALGGTIGTVFINAFKPALIALRNFMQHVLDFAKTVADALGAIFGWTIEVTASGSAMADDLDDAAGSIGDIGSGAGNAADGLGDAAGNAKDLADKLSVLPFDELNQLAKDTGGGGSGGGSNGGSNGGGGGGGGGMSGSGASASLVRTESVLEKITSNIGSLGELGAYISDALTHALEGIPWESIYEKARGFGTGLAVFLNSLITPDLFSAIGHTIAGALNTVIEASFGFNTTFDWTNLGNSIAAGINRFASDFNLPLAVESFNAWANGILTTLTTAIGRIQWGPIATKISEGLSNLDIEGISTKFGELWNTKFVALKNFTVNIDWDELGTKLGNGINGFFTGLKLETVGASLATAGNAFVSFVGSAIAAVNFSGIGSDLASGLNKFFSTINFKNLGVSVSGLITGIETFFSNALGETNWLQIGTDIGVAFGNIDWLSVIGNAAVIIVKLGAALLQVVVGAITGITTELASSGKDIILAIIGGIVDGAKELGNSFAGAFNTAMTEVDVFISNIRIAFDNWLIDMKNSNPIMDAITNAFGITNESLQLDIDAQIKHQTDLRERNERYLEELGQVTSAEDKTGGNTLIDAAAEIDKADNKKGYKPTVDATAGLTSTDQSGLSKEEKTVNAIANFASRTLGLSKDQKTINAIANFVSRTLELSKDEKTINAIANFVSRTLGLDKNEKTINTVANFMARTLGLSKDEKTITTIANFLSRYINLSDDEKTINTKSNYTSSKDSLTSSEKTIGVTAKVLRLRYPGAQEYNGGVFRNGRWQPIQNYASGGAPPGGQMFIARENGNPELVGTLRGSTAVMNNNQIVASVSNGVAKAISNIRFAMTGFKPPEIDMKSLSGVIEYAVASAIAHNTNDRPIQNYVTVTMPNGEVLARAVNDGNKKIQYRESAVSA